MKTLNFPRISLATSLLSIVFCGCQADSPTARTSTMDAGSEVPRVIVAEAAGETVHSPEATTSLESVETEVTGSPTTAGIFDLLPVVPTDMSPDVAEVVKLAHSGVSEEVQLAFVEASRSTLQPTADEIVYLQDVGVSAEIVSALIRTTSQNAEAMMAAEVAYDIAHEDPAPTAPAEAPDSAESVSALDSSPPPVIVSAPERVTQFYDELSPYGRWIEVDGYGWCWKPSVAVVNVGWQPYRDRGRWLHSDLGWYWQSDYQWGWVAFHYGRWFADPVYGWCWYPDTVWGPSWVTWRTSGTYVGWAPLPPYSYYRPGVGFIYRDRHVSFSFGFGLSYSSYSWCGYRNLCSPNVYRYCEPRNRHRHHHYNSTVVNNYVVGDNNVIINNGVHVDRVNMATGEQVKRVNVRHGDGSQGRPDHVYTRGEDSVVLAQSINNRPSARAIASKSGTPVRGRSIETATASSIAPSDTRESGMTQTRRTGTTQRTSVATPSSSRHSSVSPASTSAIQSPSTRKATVQQRTVPTSNVRASSAGRTTASSTSQTSRDSYRTETKSVQDRGYSRPATTQSRTISSAPARRTTVSGTSSRVTSTKTRQPSPVIISPSGASSNSRFPKPTIIGPNSQNSRSTATSSRSSVRSLPSASRSSSVVSTPSSSLRKTSRQSAPRTTPSPRMSTSPSPRSSIVKPSQSRSVSRPPVQSSRSTQPSSRSTGRTTQTKPIQSRSR